MSLDDWILALHVLSAFALVAAMVVFWVMVAVPRTVARDDPRLGAVAQVAGASIGIGSLGTIVFGTWLALSVGGYDLWDGWILAAYGLWVIGVGTGPAGGRRVHARRQPAGAHLARNLERRHPAPPRRHDLEAGRLMELALFTHVLGAMILVGGLLAGATLLAFARGEAALLRLGYWSLLAVALPGYVVMRIGAHWTYSEQGWDELEERPDVARHRLDRGRPRRACCSLIALVVGGIGVYRLRDGKGQGLLKAAMVIALLILAAALVAAWAMSGKPD